MHSLIRRNDSDLDYFDNLFEGIFNTPLNRSLNHCMRTDIKEKDDSYSLVIDVPGFGKEDIKISLENGYLTVEAAKDESKENKDSHFLRRERYYGSAARTFYVGDDIAQEDVKAAYDKGVLTLTVPKQGSSVQQKKFISIE